MSFTLADGKIWVRCYQINETEAVKGASASVDGSSKTEVAKTKGHKAETQISLTEIGPRFVLTCGC